MKETIGTIILATVCILMACLNLWNIFKDWFDGRYQKKSDNSQKEYQPTKQKFIPDVMGKSKPVLRELPPIQKPEEDKEKQRLEQEVLELKCQLEEQEKNEPILSLDLREKEPPEEIDIVEEDFEEKFHNPSEGSEHFNTGTTLDEFELVAKALSGKPIAKEAEKEIGHILPKIIGTEFFNQFAKQVNGAMDRANEILNWEDDEANSSRNQGFDINKYIRT